jgi:hypothetical protein
MLNLTSMAACALTVLRVEISKVMSAARVVILLCGIGALASISIPLAFSASS